MRIPPSKTEASSHDQITSGRRGSGERLQTIEFLHQLYGDYLGEPLKVGHDLKKLAWMCSFQGDGAPDFDRIAGEASGIATPRTAVRGG
jgi:hypothetical protein